MTVEIDEKELITKVEKTLEELREDISFSIEMNAKITNDIEAFLDRMENKYSQSIKNIAIGDIDDGNLELKEILGGIYETRLQFYKRFSYDYLVSLRDDISNRLWLKNRFLLSEKIDAIDKELMETSKTWIQGEVAIEPFKNKIIELSELKIKLETEQKEVRTNLFFKTLIWGIPILLGLYISDKYSQYSLHGFLLILIAGISLYTISGSASFEKFIKNNKFILLAIFLLVMSIPFIIFYSSYVGLQVIDKIFPYLADVGTFLLPLTLGIIALSFPLMKEYYDYSKRKNLHITIDITKKQFKPGDKIPLKLVLKNKGSKIVTNISIILIASGLLLEPNKSIKIRAIGIGDTKERPYIIDIPTDSPTGDYIIQFKTKFDIETESIKKKNELTISVTK